MFKRAQCNTNSKKHMIVSQAELRETQIHNVCLCVQRKNSPSFQ
jgi:hypothetical protein